MSEWVNPLTQKSTLVTSLYSLLHWRRWKWFSSIFGIAEQQRATSDGVPLQFQHPKKTPLNKYLCNFTLHMYMYIYTYENSPQEQLYIHVTQFLKHRKCSRMHIKYLSTLHCVVFTCSFFSAIAADSGLVQLTNAQRLTYSIRTDSTWPCLHNNNRCSYTYSRVDGETGELCVVSPLKETGEHLLCERS